MNKPGNSPLQDAQLRHHYEVEKVLAQRLLKASKEERRTLYSEVYNELFQKVPYHSQIVQRSSLAAKEANVKKQLVSLRRLLNKESVFLEIGAGDCALSFEVCKLVKRVYAIEVSDEITQGLSAPGNFTLILSGGSDIPVPEGTIDLAYSHQLMEHLHPDDAEEQLQSIFRSLASGGRYFCITPNRAYGPHDVSKLFDAVATGFHLKEYTIGELSRLMKRVGFSKVYCCVGTRTRYAMIPASAWSTFETILMRFPISWRRSFLRPFLQNRIIAVK